MTLDEYLANDVIAKAADFGSHIVSEEQRPGQARVRIARRRSEIRDEIGRLNQRDFAAMSKADRNRKRDLLAEWAILDGHDLKAQERIAFEEASRQREVLKKFRPQALFEACEREKAILECVNSPAYANLPEPIQRRLRIHLSAAQIEIQELSR